MPIGLRIAGQHQDARGFFVQPVASLGQRIVRAGQTEDVINILPILQGGDKRGFVDDKPVSIFKKDPGFDRSFFHLGKGTSCGGRLLLNAPI